MALVKRGNAERVVDESKVEEFLNLGYSLIDPENGKVLKKSIPQTKSDFELAYRDALKEIEILKTENASLQKKNKALEKKLEEAKKE